MLEQMMDGYEKSFEPDFHEESDVTRPESIRLVSKQAAAGSWKTLAVERIKDTRPIIPLGRRFWPISKDETRAIEKLFADEQMRKLATMLRSRKDDAPVTLLDAAYWMKGCSSLGRLRYAILLRVGNKKGKGPEPANKTIAFLAGRDGPYARTETENLQPAARILGVRLLTLLAPTESEVQTAFDTIVEQQAGALLIGSDAAFIGAPYLTRSVISHAARHAIPTMFAYSEAVAAGGLSSYGPDLADGYHQAGLHTGRILKGEKPADMPVVRPVKFRFAINLKTAGALGIEVRLLAVAAEVI